MFHSALRARQAPSVELKVGFILARSFTLTAFALFIDTLRLASDETDRSGRVNADWEVLSNTRHLVTSSCGVQVSPTSSLRDPMEFDYIVVVGGRLSNGQAVDGQTIKYLREAASRGARLIGICTGTFILAEAGLMAAHETCVSWLHYLDFRERFPGLQVQVTYLKRQRSTRLHPLRVANPVDLQDLKRISFGRLPDMPPDQLCSKIGCAAAARTRSACGIQVVDPVSPRLRAALILMEQNVENLLLVSRLAAVLGISRRQLERLFFRELNSSPALVYRRVRLERAKQLLRTSDTPLIEVAIAAGFENASHFGRVFRTVYGQPPSVWRRSRSVSEKKMTRARTLVPCAPKDLNNAVEVPEGQA
ncbi:MULTISPECIES: helix-turn-helix domain-containing protein [unclassified Mesorhizobium]|uniref:GlxA family transcriptional regulator n=1 Tax=unclassified Mesorhizobium TaxID=325217 RepID=UPI001FDF6047|nr:MULTISPECIES: helix-turn-helix domain-containing protein [unclassified Mesorhizobium]